MDELLGYFITFRTYGTWLHGDERGSTDWRHNVYQSPHLGRDEMREKSARGRMKDEPYIMGDAERGVVYQSIKRTCGVRDWTVWTLKVRTNHVHVVLRAPGYTAERVMIDLKAYATRDLRRGGLIRADSEPWSQHGSTPHLYTVDQLQAAIAYVELMQD